MQSTGSLYEYTKISMAQTVKIIFPVVKMILFKLPRAAANPGSSGFRLFSVKIGALDHSATALPQFMSYLHQLWKFESFQNGGKIKQARALVTTSHTDKPEPWQVLNLLIVMLAN